MDLNIPKGGFRHMLEYMGRREATYTAATGLLFPRPIPGPQQFMETWKEMTKPLELQLPVSVGDHPRVAALGRYNHGLATSNGVHCLWTPSFGQGLSHSSFVGMHTRVMVVVGPNYPLVSSTTPHPHTRLFVVDRDGGVRIQRHGRISYNISRKPICIRSFCCGLISRSIFRG